MINIIASPVVKELPKDKTDYLMQTGCHQIQLNPYDQKPQKELIYYPRTEFGEHCGASITLVCHQCWGLPVHICLPTLCSQPVVRFQHACFLYIELIYVCGLPLPPSKNFTRGVFFQHDLEVIVSCDTQKCNHSSLELTLTVGRSRELACSNLGEDYLSSHLCGLLCSTCEAASCDQLFQIPYFVNSRHPVGHRLQLEGC